MGGRRDLHSVRAIAAGQRGLITREQLLAAGVTRRVLDTLALGPTAAASDRSAAELWDVLEPRGRALHVTLPTRDGLPARDAIVVHRRELRPDERTRRAGVPCTTLARTLFDLAAGERRVFARAFEEAQVTHGFRPAVLAAAMLARPGTAVRGRCEASWQMPSTPARSSPSSSCASSRSAPRRGFRGRAPRCAWDRGAPTSASPRAWS